MSDMPPNGHRIDSTSKNETHHARFPHPNPLPEGEGTNERLRKLCCNAALNDERLALIVESYRLLTGKVLIEPFDPLALWKAKRAIVAHGTEADPVFFYGNKLALQWFEMRFEEFVRLPSRFSAEPEAQPVRAALLEKVAKQGFIDGYSGLRIARSGKRFTITDGTVWNLLDASGILHGQAATFIVQNM